MVGNRRAQVIGGVVVVGEQLVQYLKTDSGCLRANFTRKRMWACTHARARAWARTRACLCVCVCVLENITFERLTRSYVWKLLVDKYTDRTDNL